MMAFEGQRKLTEGLEVGNSDMMKACFHTAPSR
jgi:hypothetical protein